jgi:hypothetical protein
MLDAYKLGAQTLDLVLKKQNLTVERVEATMDLVDDALADHADVQEAMSIGGRVDDEGLEAELEKLMIGDGERVLIEESEKVLKSAPSVPDVALVVEVKKADEKKKDVAEERQVEEVIPA